KGSVRRSVRSINAPPTSGVGGGEIDEGPGLEQERGRRRCSSSVEIFDHPGPRRSAVAAPELRAVRVIDPLEVDDVLEGSHAAVESIGSSGANLFDHPRAATRTVGHPELSTGTRGRGLKKDVPSCDRQLLGVRPGEARIEVAELPATQ